MVGGWGWVVVVMISQLEIGRPFFWICQTNSYFLDWIYHVLSQHYWPARNSSILRFSLFELLPHKILYWLYCKGSSDFKNFEDFKNFQTVATHHGVKNSGNNSAKQSQVAFLVRIFMFLNDDVQGVVVADHDGQHGDVDLRRAGVCPGEGWACNNVLHSSSDFVLGHHNYD